MTEEKRTEDRAIVEKYHSVELSVSGLETSYQFRIRDLSPGGVGILVREDSALLKHIQVGAVFQMTYYPIESKSSAEVLNTEVRHITRNGQTTYKGHYTVGLAVLKE